MQHVAWGVGQLASLTCQQSQRAATLLLAPCSSHVITHLGLQCRALTYSATLNSAPDPCHSSPRKTAANLPSRLPMRTVTSHHHPLSQLGIKASEGLRSCTATSGRSMGTMAAVATRIKENPHDSADPGNDVAKLLRLIQDAPINRSSWDAHIGDVSRMLKGDVRFARRFIDEGGVQSLVKMLEEGKLSVYLSDLPVAVSLSVHFPVESLLRLGFMEALVEGLKAKVTSGTPAPFVRDSICRAIEALLQKEAISGVSVKSGFFESPAQQAIDAGLLRPLGDMMRNDVSLINVAGVVASLALSGDHWRMQLLDAGFLHELLRHVRMLQLRLFDVDSADGRTSEACGRALAVLCTAGDSRLRSRIVAAGVVQPLLQLAIVGSPPAVQGPVYEALKALSGSPGVRRQMLNARVRQDWNLTPQAWNSWWHDLALRCSLTQKGALSE